MNLEQWLQRLEKLHFKSIDMGLERVAEVAQRLNLYGAAAKKPFVFTVAGTNGKGSTVAMLERMIRKAGGSVASYTSPHLMRFNERIVINAQECSNQQIISAFEAVEAARAKTSLTYFEFTTLAAFWLFSQQTLDAWVLEVGLGGRLDAVNIIDPDIAIVTSVDLDHQAWLGSTRSQIGLEKIGIGRANTPLVVGEPDLPEPVIASAKNQGFRLFSVNSEFRYQQTDGNHWAFKTTPDKAGQCCDLQGLIIPNIHLGNASAALQALLLSPFPVSIENANAVLRDMEITGRQQIVQSNPTLMIDVGHNPHAARWLHNTLYNRQFDRVHCVVGMLNDKAVKETLTELLPCVDQWYPVTLTGDRGLQAQAVADILSELGVKPNIIEQSPGAISKELLSRANTNDLVLVFGSFYTVADVLTHTELTEHQKEEIIGSKS